MASVALPVLPWLWLHLLLLFSSILSASAILASLHLFNPPALALALVIFSTPHHICWRGLFFFLLQLHDWISSNQWDFPSTSRLRFCCFLPKPISGTSNSLQFCSVTQSCLTLCYPMSCSTPGHPDHHQLPEFTQTHAYWVGDAIQPSHPLSSPSSPALNLSQHQGLFKWVSSSHQVAKALEFQLQHQSYQWTPRTGLL